MMKSKPLVWLHGEVKTPPLSTEARIEAGYFLRRLQNNERLSLPHSRLMTWRIIYRLDDDAVVILEVFEKKSQATPKSVIEIGKKRIIAYDRC